MRAVTIGQNEAGQRLDKFLNKYMKEAGVSFFYKMMRKKNIVLNGKKCTGKEILLIGDEVKLQTTARKKRQQGRKQKNIFWHLRN